LIPVGRVVKLHGVKGRIKAQYFGDDPRGFDYREVLIEDVAGGLHAYEILETIPQPSRLILHLRGIKTAEDAQPLVGKEIFIRKEDLAELPADEYYWAEISGMVVETEKGKGIGKVKEVFSTGANDVFVVEGKRGEILLPATKEVIRAVDRRRGVITVRRMEGIWEDEDEV